MLLYSSDESNDGKDTKDLTNHSIMRENGNYRNMKIQGMIEYNKNAMIKTVEIAD